MGIDTEPLAHYALRILWKGSVHMWRTLKGQKGSVDLGFQEPICRYLIGDTGFPDGVYVVVTACSAFSTVLKIFVTALNALYCAPFGKTCSLLTTVL